MSKTNPKDPSLIALGRRIRDARKSIGWTQEDLAYESSLEYGKLKIYSDRQGHPLDSPERAARVLESIRYELDQHTFDPSKYVAADLKDFKFENRIDAWYQSKKKEVEKTNLANSYVRVLNCYIEN